MWIAVNVAHDRPNQTVFRCRLTLEPVDLQALAFQLACPANRLGLFSGPLLGWFFVGTTALHFAPQALALHFLLQRFQGLLDVVIADTYIQNDSLKVNRVISEAIIVPANRPSGKPVSRLRFVEEIVRESSHDNF